MADAKFDDEYLQQIFDKYKAGASLRLNKLDSISNNIKQIEFILKPLALPETELEIVDDRLGFTCRLYLVWDGTRVNIKQVPHDGRDVSMGVLLESKSHLRVIAGDHLAALLEKSLQQGVKQ